MEEITNVNRFSVRYCCTAFDFVRDICPVHDKRTCVECKRDIPITENNTWINRDGTFVCADCEGLAPLGGEAEHPVNMANERYTYRIKKLLGAGFTDDQADALIELFKAKEAE